MSLTIQPSHAYFLLAGLYLGKLTNLASDVIITGLVLYIVTPQIFTEDRIERVKNWCWSWFEKKPVTIDITQLQLTDEQKLKLKILDNTNTSNQLQDYINKLQSLPKIEIVQSPKVIQ